MKHALSNKSYLKMVYTDTYIYIYIYYIYIYYPGDQHGDKKEELLTLSGVKLCID